MKKTLAILAAIAFFVTLTWAADVKDLQRNTPTATTTAIPVRSVEVLNFPDPQSVAGTVNVGNLPAVQTVTGTVSIDSLPASPQAARMQLVGFTVAVFDGGQGPFTFTLACQAEYPGSRFCLDVEIRDTVTIPDLTNGTEFAWVNPTNEMIGTADNCNYWDSRFHNGVGITKTGAFKVVDFSCGSSLSVACCAPVP